MPEIMYARKGWGQHAAADYDVGIELQDWLQELFVFKRVVLEICVLKKDVVTSGVRKPCANRRPFAAVLRLLYKFIVKVRVRLQERQGLVLRAIINHDDFDLHPGHRLRSYFLKNGQNRRLLVVSRHYDTQRGHRGIQYHVTPQPSLSKTHSCVIHGDFRVRPTRYAYDRLLSNTVRQISLPHLINFHGRTGHHLHTRTVWKPPIEPGCISNVARERAAVLRVQ